MSDFTERARTEAVRRMVAKREQVGLMVHEQRRYIEGFGDGARWARGVLMADPADAEVEQVAEFLVAERYRMHGVSMENARKDEGMWRADIEFLRPQARAVIAAFLAARRGSE